ncbi:MAG TPA: Gfo/Idh/MocA family oxidoreductase [Actinomycetales bacterium]
MTAAAAVRFGFLGAGYIAERALGPAVHAADGAVLQAVGARDAARAAALEPAGRAHDTYQAVVDDPDVDVVYVALPNDDHLPWTLAALAAGKHVLCEKPLGLDPGEVQQMLDAAAAAGRHVVEATWYRWHPRSLRSRELVRSGAVGDPVELSAAWCFGGVAPGNYRLDPARGGGAWYDIGCYGVSAAHLLLGDALRVQEATVLRGPTGVDLETRAVLTTPSGARARVLAGIDADEHQDLTLRGSSATLAWSVPQLGSWRIPSSLTLTPDGGGDPVVEEFAAVDAYQLMVEQLVRVVRGDEAPEVTLQESLRVSATLRSVVEQAAVEQAVVEQAGVEQAAGRSADAT